MVGRVSRGGGSEESQCRKLPRLTPNSHTAVLQVQLAHITILTMPVTTEEYDKMTKEEKEVGIESLNQ